MAIELSSLMEAANGSGVRDESFYRKTNTAFASLAADAVANTPETVIAAQEKQAEVQIQQSGIALDVLMQAHAKDQESFQKYEAEFKPREQDYSMLQAEREANLRTITEIERDPTQNSIFHPIKTIIGKIKQSRAEDQNNAIINEMNAINDGMGAATAKYIAESQHNEDELRFNLQTKVELGTAAARIAAQQEEKNASMRYQDTQADIGVKLQATQGLSGITLSEQMAKDEKTKATPTDQELAHYRAVELGQPYNDVVTDAERPNLLRAYMAKPVEARSANAIAAYNYLNYRSMGEGSTEAPTSFAQSQLMKTQDQGYARELSKLIKTDDSEIANLGLEALVNKTVQLYRANDAAGIAVALGDDYKKSKAVLAQLKGASDSGKILSEVEQQVIVRNLLQDSSFKTLYKTGIEQVKGEASSVLTKSGTPYADPDRVSDALKHPDDLLSVIPSKFLAGRDEAQLKMRADVISKVNGMEGGNLLSHKMIQADDFMLELGITSRAERVFAIQKWLQLGARGEAVVKSNNKHLVPSVMQTLARNGEDFIIPIRTAPERKRSLFSLSSVEELNKPEFPEVALETAAGVELYLLAARARADKPYAPTVQGTVQRN